ncbi:MAG TPA: hypothetical protein VGS22_10355 [Thermoanaerobaculia bacterium]|nr:hypothetical protein [Thermoanaerobaculia bacterium]
MGSEAFALPQGWIITDWKITAEGTPEGKPEEPTIPEDAFVVGGTLLIAIGKETFPPVYTLAWLDGGNRWSTVAGLDLSDKADSLAASGVEAKIGPTTLACYVQLVLSDQGGPSQLVGKIQTHRFGTGNVGSFAAEAHIPPFPSDDRRG